MKKHRTLVSGILVAVLVFVFAGCRQTSSNGIPTVTGVTVMKVGPSPLGLSESEDSAVARGQSEELMAIVEGNNNPPQAVSWYIVDGDRQSETMIGADGVLHVAASESLPSLTVGARSMFDMRWFGHITLYLEGDIVTDPDPKPDPDPEQLEAPVIWLDVAMLLWNEVPGAGGYRLRVGDFEYTLGPGETSFNLAGLGLPVGSHSITLVALGVYGQSLDSPESSEVIFHVIIATGVTVTVTVPDLRDMAGYINIEVPPFSMLGEPGRIVFGRENHNVDTVEWFMGETPVPDDAVLVDGTLYTLVLDSRIHGNMEGPHFVTLEVVIGGIRYSRVIAFMVTL